MNNTAINNTAFAKEKARPGYKKTKLGWIPEEWDFKPISSVTPRDEKYGIVDGPFGSNLKRIHYKNSGIPIITSGYVTSNKFIANDYLYVTKEKFQQEKRSAVQPGDIVMAKIGAKCGTSAILPIDHQEGILSGNALKIKIDNTRHSTFYVWQVLLNLYRIRKIDLLKSVGAQPAISMSSLKKFKIPLPPLPEQQKIASILNTWDKAIAAQEQLIAQKQELKKGLMQALLTAKKRFDGFEEEWETSKLGNLFTIQGRVGWKGYKKEDIRDSGPVVIGAKHIKNQILDLSEPTHLSLDKYEESPEIQIKVNDLLIVQRGSLGKVAVIENDIGQATINPSMAILRPLSDNVLVKYIYYFLCSDFSQNLILSETGSTGVPMISQKQIATFKMTYPSIKEQNKIVNTLEKIDEEFFNLRKILGVIKKQKQGLMQQLLTGEKRVEI